jgi:NAD(P)-dependent dehydrogenase (short-subunit alcohol dehydrogenase family)
MGDWISCFAVVVKVSEIYCLGVVVTDLTAVIGTIEELAASPRTQMLTREQMETNFFGPINVIKSALPAMREKKNGHIIVLTGISELTCIA